MRPEYALSLLMVAACGPPSPPAAVEPLPTCAAPVTEVAFTTAFIDGDAAPSHRFAGAGLGIGDLDGDGALDLVAPGPTRLRWWRQAAPRQFVEVPLPERIATLGSDATGVAMADVDRDGDIDVWVTRFGPPDVLLVNDGTGTLSPHDAPQMPHYAQGAAFVDLDRDGWLDIVVAGHGPVAAEEGQTALDGPADPTRVLRQQPPATPGTIAFTSYTDGIDPGAHDAYTFVVTPTELDGDGRPDLLLANDFPVYRPNQALLQTDAWGFALAPESGLHVRAAGMGVAVHDVDGDGWDDFVLPVWNRLVYLRSSDGRPPRWIEAQAAAGLEIARADPAWVGWGADFGDLDADGLIDLVVGFGHLDTVAARTAGGGSADNALVQPDLAFRGLPDGRFDAVAWPLDHPGPTRGILTVDLDGDGWLDVVRRDLDGPIRLDWAACRRPGTLLVELDPPADAIGATIRIRTARDSQHRTLRAGGESLGSSGPPVAHFGLGDARSVRDVTVTWPDGTTQRTSGPFSPGTRLRIRR